MRSLAECKNRVLVIATGQLHDHTSPTLMYCIYLQGVRGTPSNTTHTPLTDQPANQPPNCTGHRYTWQRCFQMFRDSLSGDAHATTHKLVAFSRTI